MLGLAVVLLAAGAPLLSIRLQYGSQANVLPRTLESVQVQRTVQDRFPGGDTGPVTVVADATPEQLEGYLAGLRALVPATDLVTVGRP
jgi:uncharacterized membrane protein YdfJ with MMPL/SSD domain